METAGLADEGVEDGDLRLMAHPKVTTDDLLAKLNRIRDKALALEDEPQLALDRPA